MLEVTEVQSRHTIENSQVINALELEAKKTDVIIQKNKDLQRELNNTKKRKGDNTAAINKLTREIDQNTKEIDQNKAAYLRQVSAMKSTEMTGGQLKRTLTLLKAEQDSLSRSSDAYTRNLKEQSRVQAEVTVRSNRATTAKGFMGDIQKGIPSAIAGAVGGITVGFAGEAINRIMATATRALEITAKIADSQADIRKTTDLTTSGIAELEGILKGLDTRTKREELRSLAVEAGKLGIQGVEDIAKFVEEADKIKVALGEDLGDDAIIQLGKISNAYKVEMINIASAINALGSSSEAGEQYLVDFTARLAGTAVTAKVSAPEILGYGAVLDSLGLQVEMSGTALSNFFIDFVKDSSKFEKASGMVSGSLKEMIGKEGTNAGFVAFLENLKASSKSSEDFLNKLADIGIDGSRGAAVFLSLANNVEMVKEQQALANAEYDAGTSILNEFNIKNTNTAAILEKIGKWWSGFWQSGAMTGFVNDIVVGFGKLIGVVSEADLKMQLYLDKRKEFEQNEESLTSLMSRHDELKEKVGKSAVEQEELRSVISKITAIVPEAGTAFDNFGNALDINRGKVGAYIETQKQLLLYYNKAAIAETEQEILLKDKEAKALAKKVQTGKEIRVTTGTGGGALYEAKLTSSELQAADAERRKLNEDVSNLKLRLDGLRGDYLKVTEKGNTPSRGSLSRQITLVTNDDVPLLGGTTTPTSTSGNGAAKSKADALRKEEQQLIEVRAEIALLRDQETASEMQKELLQLNANWEKKKRQIETQFADEKTLTAQQTQLLNSEKILAEREYETKVSEVTEKFDKVRRDQIAAAQSEAAKLIIDSRVAALKLALEDAKQSGDLTKIQDALINLSFADEGEALAKATAYYDKLATAAKDNADALVLIEANRVAAMNEIEMQFSNDRLEIVEDTHKKLVKEFDGLFDKGKISRDKEKEEWLKLAIEIAQYFNEAFSGIADIAAGIGERQMQRIEKQSASELTALENKKNAGIISEQEYQKARVNAEEQAAKKIQEIKRKQAQLDKAQAMSEAIMQAALGVLKNLGNPLRVAFAVALGGINIARIAAQPIPYYSGGYTQDGTHAATLGEHGKEYVIPNWMFRDPAVVDTVALLERKRMVDNPYAYTNSTAPIPAAPGVSQTVAPTFTPSGQTATDIPLDAKTMYALINKLLIRLDTPLEATWEHDAMKRYQDRISQINKDAMQ